MFQLMYILLVAAKQDVMMYGTACVRESFVHGSHVGSG